MNKKLKSKKECLIKNFPKLIEKFNNSKNNSDGPEYYFYKRVFEEVKKNKPPDLFDKRYFIELLYAALLSWGMNTRRAKMKCFEDFRENILENKEYFLFLSKSKLGEIGEKEFEQLGILYDNLFLMEGQGRLVSNSKMMHFLLPDLVVPMDGRYVLNFFFENTGESRKKFLEIIEFTQCIANETDLSQFLDKKWNTSIPKIIDNAIIMEIMSRVTHD